MKYIMMVFFPVAFLIGSVSPASADLMDSSRHSEFIEQPQLNAQDHLTKAQNLEQEIEQLAEEVIRLDQKMNKFKKKPYLDTKGIRRSGLKLLIGTKLNEIKTLREQMAWHREEASRLQALEHESPETEGRIKQRSARRAEPAPSGSRTMSQS